MGTLLVRGGTVVTPETLTRSDVLAVDGTITTVGPGLSAPTDARVVDAHGLLVFPGLIDPHVHLREPGGEHKEDIATGTRAALAGGFTTVLMMPNTRPPISDSRTLGQVRTIASASAACDYGFYIGATCENASKASGLTGVAGLKMYMGSSTGSLLVAGLAEQVSHFEEYPGLIAVHAEDEEAVALFSARGQRRPPLCAALAVSRAITLCEHFSRPLHICHVSTCHELSLIREAKNRGSEVTCEVTPHHLLLTSDDEHALGPMGRMNPPLRSRGDVDALWNSLGDIDCLATDHAPHALSEKQGSNPPAGVPGLETALPLMMDAVHAGRLSLGDIARLSASGPARIFQIDRKGHIAPGYDADITVLEPDAEWYIGDKPLFTKCGWSPFKGRRARGRVARVFLRGREVYAQGRILDSPGYSQPVRFGGESPIAGSLS